jgi:glycosyltransferase involved in cell wall biosynthesis
MFVASPTVSICVPVRNGERFLPSTIRSALDQTFRDIEVVLLDNASTDDTPSVMASFDDPRIRVVRNSETLEMVDNWNRAIGLGGAPLVKLLCADDLLHPRCVELQVRRLQADPGIALVAARRHMIDERNRVIAPNRGLSGLTGVHSGSEVARRVVRSGTNPIGEPGGVLFRREHFDAVGGWRAEHRHVMDLDLWMRLLPHGRFVGLPQTLAAFRIGTGSLSASSDRAIYDEQRRLVDEVSAAVSFDVRRRDLRIGRLSAPAGRARRRALFAASNLLSRRPQLSGDPTPLVWR